MMRVSKAVLISIRPKWCAQIVSGRKTIEVRRTRPKLQAPFKCYIYCVKSGKELFWTGPKYSYADDHSHNAFDKCGNGRVIGEFTCDQIIEDRTFGHNEKFYGAACMNAYDAAVYAMQSPMYGWHISNLKVYDTPRALSEFTGLRTFKGGFELRVIDRPPQSWTYVQEVFEVQNAKEEKSNGRL